MLLYLQVTCQVTAALANVLCISSVWSVIGIALDRYLAITYCLRYSTWSPKKYGGGIMLFIWIISLVLGLSPLLSWGGVEIQNVIFTCVTTWTGHISYAITVLLVCYISPLAVMSFSYWRIITVARKHARRIGDVTAHADGTRRHVSTTGAVAAGAMFSVRRLSMLSFPGNVKSDFNSCYDNDFNSGTSVTSNTLPIRRNIRATLRLLGLTLIFVTCWFPYSLLRMYNSIYGDSNYPYVVSIALCLALTNSAINPIVYAICSKHFRYASKRLIRCKKSTVVEVNRHNNHDFASSYTSFLRNLRTPALEGHDHAHASPPRTPETSSSVIDSRPSSAFSDSVSRRQLLAVPRHSIGDTTGFLLPNAVSNNDTDSLSRGTESTRGEPGISKRSSVCTIAEYLYDKQNTANIEIRLELVI
ncbi:histamine H2 receptor-like [Haliotis rufescens]|uniref:histamine H2 receptor-like n=1 Tax=Haliotis rufescens TaxID=6454 RepID=UPI00201F4F97|nr:histamine H2 receptor-like [Haliotis rufescens]